MIQLRRPTVGTHSRERGVIHSGADVDKKRWRERCGKVFLVRCLKHKANKS